MTWGSSRHCIIVRTSVDRHQVQRAHGARKRMSSWIKSVPIISRALLGIIVNCRNDDPVDDDAQQRSVVKSFRTPTSGKQPARHSLIFPYIAIRLIRQSLPYLIIFQRVASATGCSARRDILMSHDGWVEV